MGYSNLTFSQNLLNLKNLIVFNTFIAVQKIYLLIISNSYMPNCEQTY